MKGIDLADLPPSAAELVELIGLPATVRLIESLPSIKLPIPKWEDGHAAGAVRFAQLVEACGRRAARALVKRYGGTKLYIPSCRAALLRARDRQIVAEYDEGASVIDLALRWKLSDRQIETILSRTDTAAPAPSNQVELF